MQRGSPRVQEHGRCIVRLSEKAAERLDLCGSALVPALAKEFATHSPTYTLQFRIMHTCYAFPFLALYCPLFASSDFGRNGRFYLNWMRSQIFLLLDAPHLTIIRGISVSAV